MDRPRIVRGLASAGAAVALAWVFAAGGERHTGQAEYSGESYYKLRRRMPKPHSKYGRKKAKKKKDKWATKPGKRRPPPPKKRAAKRARRKPSSEVPSFTVWHPPDWEKCPAVPGSICWSDSEGSQLAWTSTGAPVKPEECAEAYGDAEEGSLKHYLGEEGIEGYYLETDEDGTILWDGRLACLGNEFQLQMRAKGRELLRRVIDSFRCGQTR